MRKIYYDAREGIWVENLDVTYLAPELYYEVKESEDDKDHHVFETDKGVVEFASDPLDSNSFFLKYNKLKSDNNYIRRKEWRVNPTHFHTVCRHCGIE